MSKQTGLIKLQGNIGGISFYKAGGADLQGLPTDRAKNAFKTTLLSSVHERTIQSLAGRRQPLKPFEWA